MPSAWRRGTTTSIVQSPCRQPTAIIAARRITHRVGQFIGRCWRADRPATSRTPAMCMRRRGFAWWPDVSYCAPLQQALPYGPCTPPTKKVCPLSVNKTVVVRLVSAEQIEYATLRAKPLPALQAYTADDRRRSSSPLLCRIRRRAGERSCSRMGGLPVIALPPCNRDGLPAIANFDS